MTNEFKKLIRKEFGDTTYYKYFFSYQSLLYDKDYDMDSIENDEVYRDIYNNLKEMNSEDLKSKQKRLADTMLASFSINKTFFVVIAIYILAVYILMTQNINPDISKICIGLVSASFLYKTYEYIINKFCYVDAHIVVIYKTVLDSIIKN